MRFFTFSIFLRFANRYIFNLNSIDILIKHAICTTKVLHHLQPQFENDHVHKMARIESSEWKWSWGIKKSFNFLLNKRPRTLPVEGSRRTKYWAQLTVHEIRFNFCSLAVKKKETSKVNKICQAEKHVGWQAPPARLELYHFCYTFSQLPNHA